MRTSWKGVLRGVTLLALLTIVGLPSAFGDDAFPYEPPEARIKPPSGVTSQARIKPPSGAPTTDARIHPPGGAPSTDARINPPGGAPSTDARIKPPGGATPPPDPSFFELMLDWLRAQARIHPPVG